MEKTTQGEQPLTVTPTVTTAVTEQVPIIAVPEQPAPASTEEKPPIEKKITTPDKKPVMMVKLTDNLSLVRHSGKFDPNRVRMLVYGESGSGKTRFAATWPACVFADADDGMASVDNPNVYRIPINSWDDLVQTYEYLKRPGHPFKTIVLDSLNELQKLALGSIIAEYTAIHRSYGDLPGLSDYGKLMDMFDKQMRDFKSLYMNVIFICQVAARDSDIEQIKPQLIGKNTAREMVRMVDEVAFLAKGEGGDKRSRMMTFDSLDYVTKDRSGKLPTTITDPTHRKLYGFWTGKIESEQKGETSK